MLVVKIHPFTHTDLRFHANCLLRPAVQEPGIAGLRLKKLSSRQLLDARLRLDVTCVIARSRIWGACNPQIGSYAASIESYRESE